MSNLSSPKKESAQTQPKVLDVKTVKQINCGLAASAIQGDRDRALEKLLSLLGTDKAWFMTDADANLDRKVHGKVVKNQHA